MKEVYGINMYCLSGFRRRSKGALSTYASLLLLLAIIMSLASYIRVLEEENELRATTLRAVEVNMALLNINEELKNMAFVTISNSLKELLMNINNVDNVTEVSRILKEQLKHKIPEVANECIDRVAEDYGVKVYIREINVRTIVSGELIIKVNIVMKVKDDVLGISKMENLSLEYNTGISLEKITAEYRCTLEQIEHLLVDSNHTICKDITGFIKQLNRNITFVVYNKDSINVERNIEIALVNGRSGLFKEYVIRIHLVKLIVRIGINEYDQITRSFNKRYINLVVYVNRNYDLVVLVIKKNVL